jgi:hypothetical protein
MHFKFLVDTGVDEASAIHDIGPANAGLGVIQVAFSSISMVGRVVGEHRFL